MQSIRRYLTLILISSLILIIFSAAIQGYRAAMTVSSDLMDSELRSVLYALAAREGAQQSGLVKNDLAFQVWRDGTVVSQSNMQGQVFSPSSEYGFATKNFAGQRWRVYQENLGNNTVIVVAQPLKNRVILTEALTEATVTPFLYAVPLLAIVIFLVVTRGLFPLKALSHKLSVRKGKDLSPLALNYTPLEIQPVMDTLNTMFNRLNSAFEREQQFASNAAHELRTPLSVMKINLHSLAQVLPENRMALEAIQNDTDRMIHVVNQILLLSRTSPEFFKMQLGRVDAVLVAQKVITDLYGKIESKQQDISLEGSSITLMSTEFTLYTLLQNLIANASAYAPNGSMIQVSLSQDESNTYMRVDDSGPGIPQSEQANVLKRFYRDQQENGYKSTGSGLGLAIVGQIVSLHDGNVALKSSALGGLQVAVTLPNKQAAN